RSKRMRPNRISTRRVGWLPRVSDPGVCCQCRGVQPILPSHLEGVSDLLEDIHMTSVGEYSTFDSAGRQEIRVHFVYDPFEQLQVRSLHPRLPNRSEEHTSELQSR